MSLVTLPRPLLVDVNGVPRVGAKAYFYQPTTTTEITVYTTAAYSTPHSNPVESVVGGLFPAVYINAVVNATYKIVVTDEDDVEIYSNDNIPALGVTAVDIGSLLYPRTAAEISAGTTPTDYSLRPGLDDRYSSVPSYANLRAFAAVDGVANYSRDSLFNGVNVGAGRNTGNARGTAIGVDVLQSTGAGEDNTGVGYQAMTVCSGLRNTAIGSRAMVASTSAYQNVAVGNEALKAQTIGSRNVAVGESALFSLIDFAECTAVGAAALYSCNSHKNTAVGREAGYYITSGEHNVAIGYDALIQQTTGSNNTAVGTFACQGQSGATGGNNSALGWGTMAQMTTAFDNVAVGYQAMTAVTTGSSNVGVGKNCLLSMTTGQTNVAVGRISMDACTTGGENTAVGDNSLPSLTTGTGNVAVGKDANGTTTGTYNTALGHSTLTGLTTETNCSGVGYQAAVTGSNQVQLGNSSTTTYAYGAVQNRSDPRDKADIRDTVLGLEFIRRLRPVDFRWDYREDYGWGEKDGSKKRKRFHHGFSAPEVKAAADALGIDFGGFQDHSIAGGRDVLTIGYEEYIAPIVRSIQQLLERIENLEARVAV